jgi:saccharopine dehydrogenase (NAD+, L-glutamate forming)
MRKLLVLGAGRSSPHLIRYLLEHSVEEQWLVRVGDLNHALAASRIDGYEHATVYEMEAGNTEQLKTEIASADLVVSMLPASMHTEIARLCLFNNKHLVTPSYVSDEMLSFHEEAKAKDLLFLNEMGVDPGIDHMSAMRIIDHLKRNGVVIDRFESHTGGLIAPISDNNPWHYKITWNPRNVVLAGAGGAARFLEGGEVKLIPYHQLFRRATAIELPGYGHFDAYANRDSLKYENIYGLQGIPTLLRGTLRKGGYCAAWDALVQLGMTDDEVKLNMDGMTWAELTSVFLPEDDQHALPTQMKNYLNCTQEVIEMLEWLGIFDDKNVGISSATPAQALQKLLEDKWKLNEHDLDMIVMVHRFEYEIHGAIKKLSSHLVVEGEDATFTAMSKTVGLPIGIAVKHILNGNWKHRGVHLPVISDIYEPVLKELEKYGVIFQEQYA